MLFFKAPERRGALGGRGQQQELLSHYDVHPPNGVTCVYSEGGRSSAADVTSPPCFILEPCAKQVWLSRPKAGAAAAGSLVHPPRPVEVVITVPHAKQVASDEQGPASSIRS